MNLSYNYSMFLVERLASAQTLEISITKDAPKHPLASNHESIVDHIGSRKLTHDKTTIATLLPLNDGH